MSDNGWSSGENFLGEDIAFDQDVAFDAIVPFDGWGTPDTGWTVVEHT